MPIPRDQIIAMLDVLAGPIGPQTSLDERLERQDRWVDEGGVDLLEALLEVVASPPPEAQLQHTSIDDWNTLLIEVAGVLGKRYSEVALQRFLPLLDDDHARTAAIDIVGSVGDARAVPRLGQLMQDRRLGDDDLVRVAGALGELGGDEACRLLAQLRQAVTPAQQELRREIDIAVQVACCG
jgi:HEAT repeat protein